MGLVEFGTEPGRTDAEQGVVGGAGRLERCVEISRRIAKIDITDSLVRPPLAKLSAAASCAPKQRGWKVVSLGLFPA